jgi:integrase
MRSVRLDLPYLMADTDRHGNRRLFVRRHGRKIRIREQQGTAAFASAYTAALEALESRALDQRQRAPKGAPAGTLGWLAAAYFGSSEFKALDLVSQRTRRGILEGCLLEPREPGSADLMALCPLEVLAAPHILMLRDRRADKPGSANNRLKYLSAMLGWAVNRGILRANPARDVKPVRYASSGFHSWTPAEVVQFERRHPVGSKARLALALLLFTGPRRGDVVTFGRQHVKDGWIRFVPRKTRYKRSTLLEIPIVPELARILAASPTGELTFLETEYGRAFSAAGFGGWFRKRCDEAGLKHCSAHGLRKAGAAIAAERGATDRQLMALYGWTTASQATVYTAAADRKKLAGEAARLLGGDRTENEPAPLAIAPPSKTLKNG